ncbi:MAG TPA: hypothetical protein VE343_00095, partial [Streptosporangiaceae bacterium]|nr:hypothetical protein [Streptosporangiaceae bacterium]
MRADEPGSGPAAPQALEWQAPFPVDLRRTLSVHRRGGRDPAFWIDATGGVWRTSLTPDGPATLRVVAGPGAGIRGGDGAAAGQLPVAAATGHPAPGEPPGTGAGRPGQ